MTALQQLVQELRNKDQEVYQTDQTDSPFGTLIGQLEAKLMPMVVGMEKGR